MVKKLIIQIPCFNEEESLPISLAALPREIPGVEKVEWLIINDGSTDKTVEVAKREGVDHVVDLKRNQGLARGFMAGIRRCLELDADIIVNTDADNQYNADDIPKLIVPILEGKADIVVGARPIVDTAHFSPLKKFFQLLGSSVVRMISKTKVQDAPSGFRAFSAEAAAKMNVFSIYTYTIETLIQAGQSNLNLLNVPVRTNKDLRESRLVKSILSYIRRSVFTMLEVVFIYSPLRIFTLLGSIFLSIGLALGTRWIYLYLFVNDGRTHVPSIIVMNVSLVISGILFVSGFLSHLVSVNRKMLEEIQFFIRMDRKGKGTIYPPSQND